MPKKAAAALPQPGVTVDEAKAKWCPQVSGRETQLKEDHWRVCCIGHDCMAWRWVGRTVRGYCGLAGKPES